MCLHNLFGYHFFYKLRFGIGWLIIKVFATIIMADFAFNAERIFEGIIFSVHIEPCAILIIDVNTEFSVLIKPCFDVDGNFLPDIAVNIHIRVYAQIVFFEFLVFSHASLPHFPAALATERVRLTAVVVA